MNKLLCTPLLMGFSVITYAMDNGDNYLEKNLPQKFQQGLATMKTGIEQMGSKELLKAEKKFSKKEGEGYNELKKELERIKNISNPHFDVEKGLQSMHNFLKAVIQDKKLQ